MSRKKKNQEKGKLAAMDIQPIDVLLGVVLTVYILIPTFAPNLMSIDTNTTKFLAMSIVNLAVFILLITHKRINIQSGFFTRFFITRIGMAYTAFMVVSLLSFTQAINVLESLIAFAKSFTIFAAALNLGLILIFNIRLIKWVVFVMTSLLIVDAVMVFDNIAKFIDGLVAGISDIKTVYSNKNILASAIYVKLPFAIWLLVFERKWAKYFGWVALTMGLTATFFMSTRAFYLGLILLSLVFVAYSLMLYIRSRQQSALKNMGAYLIALAIAYGSFSFVQQFLYPKTQGDGYTAGVGERLSSVVDTQANILRLDSWRWSIELIKENPLLGVGVGNWKIDILKHENQKNPGFIYLYKAHNDFLETTSETGIPGGLLYISIYLLILTSFFRHYLRKGDDPGDLLRFLFLGFSGVAFFSVDAFFNFPHDRPEIMLLYAMFVATSIAAAYHGNLAVNYGTEPEMKPAFIRTQWFGLAAKGLAIIIMTGSIYVLYINFLSSKVQRIVFQEIKAGALQEKSERIIREFPALPDLSVWGESVATLKTRYLINENKNVEAIEMLRNDRATPWDARREFFMAMAFNNMAEYDSALHYATLTQQLKPNYFSNIHLTSSLYERKGDLDNAVAVVENFLENFKTESKAYIVASQIYINQNNLDKALELLTEGLEYLPTDSLVINQHQFVTQRIFVESHLPVYNEGAAHYQAQRYRQAIEVLSRFLEQVPDNQNGIQLRSYSYYFTNQYQLCIDDIDMFMALNSDNGAMINLRGVCYRMLEKHELACADFKLAMEKGDASGKVNFEQFCN